MVGTHENNIVQYVEEFEAKFWRYDNVYVSTILPLQVLL